MEYNRYIDHTLLAPEATKKQIEKLCSEAKENHFASVCINPSYVNLASKLLAGSDVKVCTVIGFPLGATLMASKISETKYAILEGADEIDMVINIGRLKDHDDDYVRTEIAEIKKVCQDKILKVIIECCLLTDEEKVRACQLSKEAHADFVKTSTGFSTGGATVSDVALMKQTVGDQCEVKASGGVKTYQDMLDMIHAGASRIGTSSGVLLMNAQKDEENQKN